MNKKILHVLYSGLGGHGNVFFSMVEADIKKEFSYAVAFCGIEPVLEEYVDRCKKAGVPFRYFCKQPGLDIGIYKKLYRYICELKPDIIFLHGSSFIIPAIFGKISGKSVNIIIRDTQAHHLKSRMEWFWLTLSIFWSDRIVLLSNESREFLKKKFWFLPGKRKLSVIPNGIDVNAYKLPLKEEGNKEINIGMQSRLQSIKDHPTLIRAFSLVQKKMPHYDLKLKIAGDGETKQGLIALCKELNIENQVVFTGFLKQQELFSFMHSLDIYVHASFGETMSNSIMQAMATGLPIIASDVWGVNNMISNEKNGLLYPSEDFEALAGLIEKLIDDSTLSNNLGLAARQFAVSHYSNERMFCDYKRIFTEKYK